ncbi:MAG: hypothetical protein Ct9H300mP16_15540 [Pseudomonadota bacterium]|nr:MAG: hypothetical protein Ct9H300mP16_15540 [Pseudomonadota bacterium]
MRCPGLMALFYRDLQSTNFEFQILLRLKLQVLLIDPGVG